MHSTAPQQCQVKAKKNKTIQWDIINNIIIIIMIHTIIISIIIIMCVYACFPAEGGILIQALNILISDKLKALINHKRCSAEISEIPTSVTTYIKHM